MPGKQVATLGSMHVCPLCSGLVPHIGGPIIGPGHTNILFNGKPAVTVGDMCTCTGPPDMLAQGNPAVMMNGKPTVCVGNLTAHGGTVITGESNILISNASQETIVPKEIVFPEIKIRDIIGAFVTGNHSSLKQAKQNIAQLKEEEKKEGTPYIYNLRWIREEQNIRNEKLEEQKVWLVASVVNIKDGEEVAIKIFRDTRDGKVLSEVKGVVQNQEISLEWDIEKTHFEME